MFLRVDEETPPWSSTFALLSAMEQLGYAPFNGQQHWGELKNSFFLSYLHMGAGEPSAARLGGVGIRLDAEEEEVARRSLDGERR